MSNFFSLNALNNTNKAIFGFYGNEAGEKETGNKNYSNGESAQDKDLKELRNFLSNSSGMVADSTKDDNVGYNFDSLG